MWKNPWADIEIVKDEELRNLLIDGKTKQIYDLPAEPDFYLLLLKDRITNGDSLSIIYLQDLLEIFNTINGQVFELLNNVGINTAYVKPYSSKGFLVKKCKMIPIKWVTSRIAAGSFLRRNPSVQEGQRFSPLKQETLNKNDCSSNPQLSDSEIISAKFTLNDFLIGKNEIEIMKRISLLVFEILEKALATRNITLVDMNVEFGIDEKGNILLADMIDPDSWRMWPSCDKSLMIDREVYGNLTNIGNSILNQVKNNFMWLSDQLNYAIPQKKHLVVILMSSCSDRVHCEKISTECKKLGLNTELPITSEFNEPEDILRIMREYEKGIPDLVFIVDDSHSNGLRKLPFKRIFTPVINCPPAKQYTIDAWSGLPCPTVLLPEPAALHAAQILGLNNYIIWSKFRCKQLNYFIQKTPRS